MKFPIVRDARQWDRIFEALRKHPIPGCGLEIVVRRPKRTNSQNAYLWSVCYRVLAEGLSEQRGVLMTRKQVHHLCKSHFMPQIPIPGTDEMMPMSTTELMKSGYSDEDGNTFSFGDYLECLYEFGAKIGVYIPEPNETAQV